MSIELVITIKDSEKTLRKEFLIYEPVSMCMDDPHIVRCVNSLREEFKGTPDDIKVKASMVLQ